jgi:hypothetical protein
MELFTANKTKITERVESGQTIFVRFTEHPHKFNSNIVNARDIANRLRSYIYDVFTYNKGGEFFQVGYGIPK